jgi:aspartate/methionine/tyrosine aminotransferase
MTDSPSERMVPRLRLAGHHVVSMGQALPFFGPPPAAIAAAHAALDTPEVNLYSTDPGRLTMRTALAARLSSTLRSDATADDLVITAGANHAFTLALTTLAGPGDEVILPAPYFTNHQMAVCALGATAVEAPVADRDRFAVTWADIAPHLSSRTKAVVLCTPSNPTGATIAPHAGARIVREAASRGILVISDETYMHFVYDEDHWSAASVPGWRDSVAVVGTFSKSFGMMGWRLGFMLADEAICTQAIKVQDAMIICAPVISQIAGERAVHDAWDYALGFHDDLRERRRLLIDATQRIARLSWAPTAGGLFGFVRVAGCDDSVSLCHELLETAHVVTIPGAAFGRSGEGCLRLSYGAASVEDLRLAIDRLQQFFA